MLQQVRAALLRQPIRGLLGLPLRVGGGGTARGDEGGRSLWRAVLERVAQRGVALDQAKAKKAQDESPMRVHRIRQIQGYLGDKEMTHKLVNDVAPRYAERNGGYLRILKLGPRQGDNAQMARIELV